MLIVLFLLFLVPSAWAEQAHCKIVGICGDRGGPMFIRMTEQQLIESQNGEGWTRVILVDTNGNPVPVQYDTEGRLKMAVPECLEKMEIAMKAMEPFLMTEWTLRGATIAHDGALGVRQLPHLQWSQERWAEAKSCWRTR